MKRPLFIRLLQILCIALLAIAVTPSAQAAAPADGAWAEKSAFVSPETVAVGCGAGVAAGAFAAVMPLVWAMHGQTAAMVTLPVITAWSLIGCGVGVIAGLSAVLTQAGFDMMK